MQIGSGGSAYGPTNVMSRPTLGRALRPIPVQQLLGRGAGRGGLGGRMLPPSPFSQAVLAGELAQRLAAARAASMTQTHPMLPVDPATAADQVDPMASSHLQPVQDINTPAASPQLMPVVPHIDLPTLAAGLIGHARQEINPPAPVYRGHPGIQAMPFVYRGHHTGTTVDPAMLLARARLAQMFRSQVQ